MDNATLDLVLTLCQELRGADHQLLVHHLDVSGREFRQEAIERAMEWLLTTGGMTLDDLMDGVAVEACVEVRA